MRRSRVWMTLFAALAAAASAGAETMPPLTIATGDPTGVYHAAGRALCSATQRPPGGRPRRDLGPCTTASSEGSVDNLARLKREEVAFAIVQSDLQSFSYYGSSRQVESFRALRSILTLHAEPYQIAATNPAIEHVSDLAGKRVSIGEEGSGQHATNRLILSRHRVDLDELAALVTLPAADQSAALCDGTIDAFGHLIGVPHHSVGEAVSECGATLLSLDGDVTARLIDEFPYYGRVRLPAGAYSGLEADVSTIAVFATLVTRANVPDDLVYGLTRSVFEDLTQIRRAHPSFRGLDPRSMITVGLVAPLHPGAARYYREQGWIP